MADREQRVAALRQLRPRDWFLRGSAAVMLGLLLWSWLAGGSLTGRLSAERRWINFQNFIGELVPSPVQKSGNWLDAFPWAWELLLDMASWLSSSPWASRVRASFLPV